MIQPYLEARKKYPIVDFYFLFVKNIDELC